MAVSDETGLRTTEGARIRTSVLPKLRRRGPLGRLALFYRQIVAELRKVVWPNRNDLITYTSVVIVFVVVVIAFVSLVDWGFSKLVSYVFG